MNRILTLIFVSCGFMGKAQNYDLELNLPEVPSSPAFIVMGISPSDIESPQTPSDIMFSAQNASENFTSIPKNYFINIAPFWLFNKNHIPFDDYKKGDSDFITKNMLQSLQFSLGVSDSFKNETYDRRIGLGFNLSLIRGNMDSSLLNKYFDLLRDYNTQVGRLIGVAEFGDEILKSIEESKHSVISEIRLISSKDGALADEEQEKIEKLKSKLIHLDSAITLRQAELEEEVSVKHLSEIKSHLRDIKFKRTGFFFNVAGGLAWDRNDSTSQVYRGGIWLNPGFQSKNINWTGVGRVLTHQNLPYQNNESVLDTANFTTIDVGIKLDYNIQGKGNLSSEFIYRSIPNSDMDASYRAVLNLGYNISKDIQLNLTYGKDFDLFLTGATQNITLLNLVFGIGQLRKLSM